MKYVKIVVLCLIGYGALAVVGGLGGEAIGRRIVEICENE